MMSEEAQAIFDAALQNGGISAERKRALWVAGITSPVMDDRIKGEIADREKPSAEVAAVRRYLTPAAKIETRQTAELGDNLARRT
jgi:hypothetical protein